MTMVISPDQVQGSTGAATATPPAAVAPPPAAQRPSVPTIPDSAPFTAVQRGWLNGFLAGLIGQYVPGSQVAASGAAASSGTLTVLSPEPSEAEAEEFPWHDPAIPMDERLKMVDGKPQPRRLMAAMAQLDCGACGYLCQTYAEAIADGKEKDLTRCTPGGRDTSKMLKQLVASAPAAAPAPKVVAAGEITVKGAAATAPTTGAPTAPTWDRNNPFPARLLASKKLNGPGSTKDTRLVIIDLKGSGLKYKVGDALGVYPENCTSLVQEVLEALGATGAEDVCGWDGQPTSLYEALTRDYTITRPSPNLIELLTEQAADATEKAALIQIRDDDNGPPAGLQIVELLRRFPSARVTPDAFVTALSPLAPRLYSISSSLLACPDQVHLTVGAVRFVNEAGVKCKGVASTFLSDRVRPGMKVRVFPHASHKFGLCRPDTAAIMVGPGTGIAPFRAFLQERAATNARAANWLFFGDQKAAGDFLYESELKQYQKDGVLTRLDLAFSRDQAEKVYVQDRMRDNGAELWAWLQKGAHFYVCGDAKRMASDVDKALRQLVADHSGMPAADADRYVSEMVRAGRYQRDVY